jgi:hypothetical protein
MSFLSSPSRTRGHLLQPPHREISSQPSSAAVAGHPSPGEPVGSSDVSHGRQTSGGRELAEARSTGTSVSGLLTSRSAISVDL